MQTYENTFYDSHPFDWVQRYRPDELLDTVPPVLAAAIEKASESALIVDIGCGAGRVVSYMAWKGLRCIGLDLSRVSVELMARRTGRPGLIANNVQLPLRDECVDLLISDGVIHHTEDPFRAFAENCRVLQRGGSLYLAVYKPGGRYQALYKHPGAVIRRLLHSFAGKLVVYATLVPVYYFAHVLKSKGKITWGGAKNLFHDYFVTPRVVFLSRGEIESWCRRCGVNIADYDANPRLNVHSFLLQKVER